MVSSPLDITESKKTDTPAISFQDSSDGNDAIFSEHWVNGDAFHLAYDDVHL